MNGELGNIVFYAAAPLVTSLGHRLGSLCVIDYQPREFDAECCNMLANFAEIVVRDTERYTAALEQLQVSCHPPLARRSTARQRAMDSRQVDVSARCYP